MKKIELQVIFHWKSAQDLLEKDASLSLGWLEIISTEQRIMLFSEKLCMLLPTVEGMIRFLVNAKKGHGIFQWVGEDGADIYPVEIRKQTIKINGVVFDLIAFKKALCQACDALNNYLQNHNPHARSEGFYLDYEQIFNKLIIK